MGLALYDAGRGPAVLLLHGSPSPTSDFAPLVAALRVDRRVLVPSLPGYGASPPLEGAYSFVRVYDLIETALLERGVGELAIVGFSLGAHHALALAASTRITVTRVVCLAGFAALTPVDRDAMLGFAAMMRAPGADLDTPELRGLLVQRFLTPRGQADPERVAALAGWNKVTTPAVLADELLAQAAADLRPQLTRLEVPVIARVGELDVAVPPAYSDEIVRLCRNSRLERVPELGHAQLLEQPDDTVDAIRAALA